MSNSKFLVLQSRLALEASFSRIYFKFWRPAQRLAPKNSCCCFLWHPTYVSTHVPSAFQLPPGLYPQAPALLLYHASWRKLDLLLKRVEQHRTKPRLKKELFNRKESLFRHRVCLDRGVFVWCVCVCLFSSSFDCLLACVRACLLACLLACLFVRSILGSP